MEPGAQRHETIERSDTDAHHREVLPLMPLRARVCWISCGLAGRVSVVSHHGVRETLQRPHTPTRSPPFTDQLHSRFAVPARIQSWPFETHLPRWVHLPVWLLHHQPEFNRCAKSLNVTGHSGKGESKNLFLPSRRGGEVGVWLRISARPVERSYATTTSDYRLRMGCRVGNPPL